MIFKTLLTSAAVSLAVASYAQAAVQDGTFAVRLKAQPTAKTVP